MPTALQTLAFALLAVSARAFQSPAILLRSTAFATASSVPVSKRSPVALSFGTLALRAAGDSQNEDGEPLKVDDDAMEAFRTLMQENWDQDKRKVESGEFDGYALRDLVENQWGAPYDLQLQRQMFLGKPLLFIMVMWKHLGQVSFHLTEQEYMENLQAIAELCVKWERVDHVKELITASKKYPNAYFGYAVPIPLDLPYEVMSDLDGSDLDGSEDR